VLTDHRTVHRFVAASAKSGAKTACGIQLIQGPLTAPGTEVVEAVDCHGSYLRIATRGMTFDCKRCTAVIERFKAGRISI
jgi:hypothetical protein